MQVDKEKYFPKLKCPYCKKRFADVSGKPLRNDCILVKYENIRHAQFIFECPHCHNRVGLEVNCVLPPNDQTVLIPIINLSPSSWL